MFGFGKRLKKEEDIKPSNNNTDITCDFIHWAAIVVGKMGKGIPITGWREELMHDLIMEWCQTIAEVDAAYNTNEGMF